MEKLIAFIFAVIISLSTYSFINLDYDTRIKDLKAKNLTYEGSSKTFNNYYVLNKILTAQDNNILIMGSSELSRYNENSFPTEVFNKGDSPFTVTLFGQGYYQSIVHTIALGAMDQDIKNNKVVLMVSPQWFSKKGAIESFQSVYSESLMEQFVKNDRIHYETKNKIIARTKDLLSNNKNLLDTIERFERTHYEKILYQASIENEATKSVVSNNEATKIVKKENQKNTLIELAVENELAKVATSIKNTFFSLKNKKELFDSLKATSNTNTNDTNNVNNTNNIKQVEDYTIDFNKLMENAEQQGKESSTNNPFYAYDEYFDKHMKNYMIYKNSYPGYIKDSPEFSDLQLFIDLAKALDKELMIVSVPMNAYWYDYAGYDKKQRKAYYERIRNIADKNNIKLADLTDKEYEKYILKDIMHLGWKGWVYVDEAIYNFAKPTLVE